MIDHDEMPAGFQSGKQPLIHLGAIDRQVRDVVVVEDEGDQVELRRAIGHRILERADHRYEIGLRMVGEALGERRARLFALRPNRAGRADGEREQLRGVARTRGDVEHLHARLHLRERQELGGMARRVHAPVLVRPDRTLDDGLVAQGGDARVLGRQRRAATECEQEAKNRGREVARMEGHCRLSMRKCRRAGIILHGRGEERSASTRIIRQVRCAASGVCRSGQGRSDFPSKIALASAGARVQSPRAISASS